MVKMIENNQNHMKFVCTVSSFEIQHYILANRYNETLKTLLG